LIDTGDAGAATQIFFDTEISEEESPVDHYGHGTAVGSLMRMAATRAQIYSYRVMHRDEIAVESPILLNAMTFATGAVGENHIVVVPQRAHLDSRARGQDNIMQRIIRGNDVNGHQVPIVVCAAGNDGPRGKMGYPATIPGVVVAMALDWSGQTASYNCTPPAGTQVHAVGAIGGVENDPLGNMTQQGESVKLLYGSSFATALVAASLASGR
jgi:hypothetical protein